MVLVALLLSKRIHVTLSMTAALSIYIGFLYITCRPLLTKNIEAFGSFLLKRKLRV